MGSVNDPGAPSPTEVIAAWIPHDARFREHALRHALRDTSGRWLHVYVDSLVNGDLDDGRPLDEFGLRTTAAVREDLDRRSLASVDWRTVREKLVSGLF